MRVLHVIRRLDPREGGPPAVVVRLAAAQASLGHEVGILHHGDASARDHAQTAFGGVPGFAAVRLHDMPAASMAGWLSANLRGTSHLHLHGVWDRELVTAGSQARRARVPYAIAPHGMLDPWCLTGQGLLKGLKKRVALAVTHRGLLHGAAFIHVLNADEGRLLGPLGLPAPKVVIPNGVFESEVSPLPPPGAFRAKHPRLGADPYVLFLSRLHFKKGLDVLADAFARVAADHSRVRLVVAGPDDGARQPFVDQVDKLGLRERVEVVGPLYGADKLASFVDAAAFCLPSRQEGFSMAVTEALACRAPVVISDQCHFPEVDEARAGIVAPVDAAAIGVGLSRLLAMPDAERAAMGARGRSLVLERFTWPRIAERTLAAYAGAR